MINYAGQEENPGKDEENESERQPDHCLAAYSYFSPVPSCGHCACLSPQVDGKLYRSVDASFSSTAELSTMPRVEYVLQ